MSENVVLNGKILKGIGGFYYIEAAGVVYECKARGVFRKQKITPLVGDEVSVTIRSDGENTIDTIYPRKNFLIRPPVANIEQLFILSAACNPSPNLYLIDKMTALAVNKGIEPIVVFTKSDLEDLSEYTKIYKNAGFKTACISSVTGDGLDSIKNWISGKASAFTGNSGVGKSTLLNAICEGLNLDTGEISEKLGRGRHTTRAVELHKVCGGYVADTPGFSSFDMEKNESIDLENIQYCFPEFRGYLGKCKFVSCSHTVDKGCAILEALNEGKIEKSRHESYKTMYGEAKELKKW